MPDPHQSWSLPSAAVPTSSGPTWIPSSSWRSWVPLPPLRASGSCLTRHRWARPMWGGPVWTRMTFTAHPVLPTVTAGRWVPAQAQGKAILRPFPLPLCSSVMGESPRCPCSALPLPDAVTQSALCWTPRAFRAQSVLPRDPRVALESLCSFLSPERLGFIKIDVYGKTEDKVAEHKHHLVS